MPFRLSNSRSPLLEIQTVHRIRIARHLLAIPELRRAEAVLRWDTSIIDVPLGDADDFAYGGVGHFEERTIGVGMSDLEHTLAAGDFAGGGVVGGEHDVDVFVLGTEGGAKDLEEAVHVCVFTEGELEDHVRGRSCVKECVKEEMGNAPSKCMLGRA